MTLVGTVFRFKKKSLKVKDKVACSRVLAIYGKGASSRNLVFTF